MSRRRHRVCARGELPTGSRRLVHVDGKEIGVLNVEDRLFAVLNVCPHHRAPVCAGRVGGTILAGDVGDYVFGREGLILRCPWHGYEFDLETGECTAQPTRYRLRLYEVAVEGDDVVVYA